LSDLTPQLGVTSQILSVSAALNARCIQNCGSWVTVMTRAVIAEISFALRHNRLIIYTEVLLLGIGALFSILIILFVEAGPLPGALASYFFAVWSTRVLFSLTAEGFPTLFDIGIILLAFFITVLLLMRVLGLPRTLAPITRYGRNLVRMVEGREPFPDPSHRTATRLDFP
jgi:hypothetical protein